MSRLSVRCALRAARCALCAVRCALCAVRCAIVKQTIVQYLLDQIFTNGGKKIFAPFKKGSCFPQDRSCGAEAGFAEATCRPDV